MENFEKEWTERIETYQSEEGKTENALIAKHEEELAQEKAKLEE